jgi:hypothetical protein
MIILSTKKIPKGLIQNKKLDGKLYRSYTISMKTAISIPDFLYAEVNRTAEAQNIPRSKLFTKAIEEYLHNHKQDTVTQRLNTVYEKLEMQRSSEAGLEAIRELTKNDTW